MQKKRSKKWLLFLLLSLLFHSLLLLLLQMPSQQPEQKELAALDVELLKTPKRIADIMPPLEEKRPKEADFLGEYDSTVKEEQVATTPPQPPGVPQPATPAVKPQEAPKPTPKPKSLAALYAMKKEKAQEKKPSEQQAPQKPGSLPEDFYPDYKIGPHTYLNVLRFPDIQYFVRLKRIFKMTFNPGPSLRSYMYSNLVSHGHIEVVLGVEVSPSGQLARLFVIRGSGFDRYDAEALRTVRASAPFAKPPSKILDPDKKLRMSWTFTVYL